MKVIAHDRGTRYAVAAGEGPFDLRSAVRLVDVSDGSVGPELPLGSITAQAEPDEWTEGEGKEPNTAITLALG